MKNIPICLNKDVCNIYRTKHYIVVQSLFISLNKIEDNYSISKDSFYLRNKKRDRIFNNFFKDKLNPDGKRIKTKVYMRNYIK